MGVTRSVHRGSPADDQVALELGDDRLPGEREFFDVDRRARRPRRQVRRSPVGRTGTRRATRTSDPDARPARESNSARAPSRADASTILTWTSRARASRSRYELRDEAREQHACNVWLTELASSKPRAPSVGSHAIESVTLSKTAMTEMATGEPSRDMQSSIGQHDVGGERDESDRGEGHQTGGKVGRAGLELPR